MGSFTGCRRSSPGARASGALALEREPGLVVTELSRLECRVKPQREGDASALARFDRFFASPALTIVPLGRPVFDLAAELRAQYRVKTPDALHLAAAITAGCSQFWTNDRRLERAAEGHLQVVSLEELP